MDIPPPEWTTTLRNQSKVKQQILRRIEYAKYENDLETAQELETILREGR